MPGAGARPGRRTALTVRPRVRRVLAGGLVAVLLVAAAACAPAREAGGASPASADATPSVPPAPVGTEAEARAGLGALRLAPRRRPVGYERDAFGPAWLDVDGNGCNQRDDVLLRDAVPGSVRVARQGRCDHDVLAGRWVDPYTGRLLAFTDLKQPAQAQAVQVDHLVPLAEAWASGAAAWDGDRRRVFANDLAELLAVDGPTNAAKGDDDPAAWRPRQEFQCTYAVRWVATKVRWDLAADRSERRALREMLSYC